MKYARDRSPESHDGIVTATAKIVHKGRSIHLWEIRITDERNNLISLCKLTNMILQKRKSEDK
jgi:acyl-coenzyme A thioesterase PaaI-like protein